MLNDPAPTLSGTSTSVIPPPLNLDAYLEVCHKISQLRFPTEDYGTGMVRSSSMLCNSCKTSGHPTTLCPFPNIPKWQGSTAANAASHEVTLQTYEDLGQKRGKGRGRGGARRIYHAFQGGRGRV